jgi:hypothetical protein
MLQSFDKDKLDQIINKIQTRGNAPVPQQTAQHNNNHGSEKDRSEKDLKNSQAGVRNFSHVIPQSEFGDWRRNNFRSGEFQSDAPFPTFTEDYRNNLNINTWAPQGNAFDKASPKFSFEPFDRRGVYTQHPQYEAKRGSHSERNDVDSQPQSKRDSVKPNANDFFRNLEQGKAVIKMVSKEKSARQEEHNYNCGELENDDDSLILGFLNTKLKSIAQEDPYFCGNLEEDDDDQKFSEKAVVGGISLMYV